MNFLRYIKRKLRFLLGIKNSTDFYGQAGEDAIVMTSFNFLITKPKGFYLDIGAYHPWRHSNTYLLYKKGWRGINIDPRPGAKKLFDKYRKGDINIEAGISDSDSKMTYYVLDEFSTMNTFSRDNLERLGMLNKITSTYEIPVYSIESLLKKYPDINNVDYLNIDAEGFEIQILKGINFDTFKPSVISIEQNNVLTFSEVLQSEVNLFLQQKGYSAYAKNLLLKDVATVFYYKL